MRKKPWRPRFVCSFLLWGSFSLAIPASAQTFETERVFRNPKPDVETALLKLRDTLSGQLPILDGFVKTAGEALEHYDSGYYQCVVQVTPLGSGGSLVRVTAKITAWHLDAKPAQSGYRVLPSNGRLERDLLDRLEKSLAGSPAGLPHASQPALPSAPTPMTLGSALQLNMPAAPTVSKSSDIPGPAAAAATDADLVSLRQRREVAEKRMKELSSEVQNLEEILHNQVHPSNLVVVEKSGTPVLTKPQANAPVLLHADAGDEFEMLERQGSWVHIQIAGASRGWIGRANLDLPSGIADNPGQVSAFDTGQDAPFRVSREETTLFAGDWEPLKGKTVRLIWVQPAAQDEKRTGPVAKLFFAKKVFLKAASDLTQSPTAVAGVVIVFDSADGGQAAAPLPVLERWKSGRLPDAEFWKQISLDPLAAFQRSAKP